jgi:dTDP-glucose pyrophosphorylase
MVTKGELEIADLNRLYLEREQLGVQIMGFGYGQYLLGLLGERVF